VKALVLRGQRQFQDRSVATAWHGEDARRPGRQAQRVEHDDAAGPVGEGAPAREPARGAFVPRQRQIDVAGVVHHASGFEAS